jgi:hypothetical protein
LSVQLVWRHPERREVELALYVQMRMMHVGGWRRVVVAIEPAGAAWCAVELAPNAGEDDARTWAVLFEPRRRVATTIDELLSRATTFREIYIDGGVGALLNEVERQQIERERLKREARR